ncbi:Ankyrin repeat and protein kinase domain-containing protein 1 [Balamuthia mandrillaris]
MKLGRGAAALPPSLRPSPECLDGYVVSLLDVPVAKLVAVKGTDYEERGRRTSHVPCMVTGCRADPFPMELLMAHVKDTGRKALMALRCKVEEFLLERGFEDRLKAERQMWEEESSRQKHRRYIIEHILTLQCPRCQQAFVDFDGCFALECNRCNAALCGWCLQDCGTDAHKHVRACSFSFLEGVKGYFGTFEMFKEAQRRRQVRWLEEYVGRLPPAEQEQVVASLQQELSDLGILAYPVNQLHFGLLNKRFLGKCS